MLSAAASILVVLLVIAVFIMVAAYPVGRWVASMPAPSGRTHSECAGDLCVPVLGAGADQCTMDEQCSDGYDDPPIVYAIESEPFNLTNTTGMVAISANATDDRDIVDVKIYVDYALRRTCAFPGARDIYAECAYTAAYSFGTHAYYVESTDSGKNTFITRLTLFTVP